MNIKPVKPVFSDTAIDGVDDGHSLLAAHGPGDPGHDDHAGIPGQDSTLLSAHLDQLDGRRDVEEEEEAERQHRGEEGVQVHVVDLVVVDILAQGRRQHAKCHLCAGRKTDSCLEHI